MKSSLIGALLLTFACGGCGNKGPLYLPQRPAASPEKPQPPVPTADDSKAPAGAGP